MAKIYSVRSRIDLDVTYRPAAQGVESIPLLPPRRWWLKRSFSPLSSSLYFLSYFFFGPLHFVTPVVVRPVTSSYVCAHHCSTYTYTYTAVADASGRRRKSESICSTGNVDLFGFLSPEIPPSANRKFYVSAWAKKETKKGNSMRIHLSQHDI